jgi:hypothetical protein
MAGRTGKAVISIFVGILLSGGLHADSAWAMVQRVKKAAGVSLTPPQVITSENIGKAKGDIAYVTRPVLHWEPISNGDILEYELNVSRDKNFMANDIQRTISDKGQCSFACDEDLLNKTTYYWRVRAKNNNGYGPWSQSRSFYVDLFILPPPPVLVSPIDGAKNCLLQPTFAWESVPVATEHNIQVSEEDPVFSSEGLLPVVGTTAGTVFVPQVHLKPGKFYYWRVRSIREGIPGAFGQVRSFSTINDTVPPVIKFFSNTKIKAAEIPAKAGMKAVVTDRGVAPTGVEKVLFYLGGSNPGVATKSSEPNTYAYQMEGLSEGHTTINIVAYDRVGNKAEVAVDVTVERIKVSPAKVSKNKKKK